MYADVINEYFRLRRERLALDQQLVALAPAVTAALREINGVAVLDGYDLKLRTYTSWDYSQQVVEMQQRLNEMKLKEREEGVACIREQRDTLVFTAQRATTACCEFPEIYGNWELDTEVS